MQTPSATTLVPVLPGWMVGLITMIFQNNSRKQIIKMSYSRNVDAHWGVGINGLRQVWVSWGDPVCAVSTGAGTARPHRIAPPTTDLGPRVTMYTIYTATNGIQKAPVSPQLHSQWEATLLLVLGRIESRWKPFE